MNIWNVTHELLRLVSTCLQVHLFVVACCHLCCVGTNIYLTHAIFLNLQGISLDKKSRKLLSSYFVKQLL